MDYSDVMVMPTYERRFYIDMFKREMEMKREQIEEAKNGASGGRGQRTTRISGMNLKNKMKNNQIPNQ